MKDLLSSFKTNDLTTYIESRVSNQLELLVGTLYIIIEADSAPKEIRDKCKHLVGVLHYESLLTSYIIQKKKYSLNQTTFIADYPSILGTNIYLKAIKQLYYDKTYPVETKSTLSELQTRVDSFFEIDLISEFTKQHQTPLFNFEIFILKFLFNELAQEKIDRKIAKINEKFELLDREEFQNSNILKIHDIFYNSFDNFNYFALILNRKRNIMQVATSIKNRFLPGVETNLIITFIVNLVLSLFNSDFVDKKVKKLLEGIIISKSTRDSFSNSDIQQLIYGVREFGNSWEDIQKKYLYDKDPETIAHVYKRLEKELGHNFTIEEYTKRTLLMKIHVEFEKKKKYIQNLRKTKYKRDKGIMEEDYSFGSDYSDISGIETLSDIETDDEFQDDNFDEII